MAATEQPIDDTQLDELITSNPVLVLREETTEKKLFAKIERTVAAHVYDLTTEKGRGATRSLAFDITRTKTTIDKAGKELIASLQSKRTEVWDKLETMAKDARKPLTDWEAAEAERQRLEAERLRRVDEEIKRLEVLAMPRFGANSEELANMRRTLMAYDINEGPFKTQDEQERAQLTINTGISFLSSAIELAEKQEEDAARLAKLQAAEDKRLAAEAEKKRLEDEQDEQRRREAAEDVGEPIDEPAQALIDEPRRTENEALGGAGAAGVVEVEEGELDEDDNTSDFEVEAQRMEDESVEDLRASSGDPLDQAIAEADDAADEIIASIIIDVSLVGQITLVESERVVRAALDGKLSRVTLDLS